MTARQLPWNGVGYSEFTDAQKRKIQGAREYLFGMVTDGWMAYDGRWKLCKYATGEHLLFDLEEVRRNRGIC